MVIGILYTTMITTSAIVTPAEAESERKKAGLDTNYSRSSLI